MFPRKAAVAAQANDTKKDFPRGMPYQAPQTSVEELRRLRGWCLLLGAALVVVLVAAASAFLFFRNEAPASGKEPERSPGAEDKDRSAKKERLSSVLKPAPEGRELPPPPKKIALPVAAAAEGKTHGALLETIGGLSIVHLYQTYLNIGMLADAVESETYTRGEAISIMLTVTELVSLVEKQLVRLPVASLSEEDEAALAAVRLLTGLLRTQSNALLSFWASGEEEHATRYQTAREQAWIALKEILGFED